MRAAVFLSLVVACSGTKTSPPARLGAPAAFDSQREDADDVVVAQVNGHPVWGSCVRAQAARGNKTRDAALHECIDFELLAQVANQRELATDRDVVLATRTALVSQLVAKDFEDGFTKPSDFGSLWEKAVERYSFLYRHPEFRGSTFIRIQVGEKAPPEEDAQAHAIAERIAAAVKDEKGLTPTHLLEIAQVVAGGKKLQAQSVPPKVYEGLVKPYADALYGLPEVGRATGPVRTQWGWDVILLTEIVEPAMATDAEMIEKMLPNVKQQYFPVWAAKVGHDLGVSVTRYKENIARLEEQP
jgi:hypothetical protein